jgi:hypothetical protein
MLPTQAIQVIGLAFSGVLENMVSFHDDVETSESSGGVFDDS